MRDGQESRPSGPGELTPPDLSKINEVEWRVWAPRRSGHHGVIIWIVGLYSGEVVHLNDVFFDEDGLRARPRELFRADFRRRRDALILNFEDLLYEGVARDVELAVFAAGVRSERVRNVLVLRDPYNLAASAASAWGPEYLHWGRPGEGRIGPVAFRWQMYAREFLRETRWLAGDTVFVSYNSWVADRAYREDLAERLGCPFSDEGFGIVAGAPSGFGKDVPLAQRPLLERWRSCKNEEWFRAIVADPGVSRLARAIFPEVAQEVEKVCGREK